MGRQKREGEALTSNMSVIGRALRALPLQGVELGGLSRILGPALGQGSLARCARLYSSESAQDAGGAGAESSERKDSDLRADLLKVSMNHVSSLGFTMEAIQAAGRDLGYSSAVANVFPRKESELIEYFLEDCKAKMNSELEERKEEIDAMRVRDKIAEAVRIRLKLTAPYVQVWPRAIYVMSQPPNVANGLLSLHRLMDDMWYAAGDKSTDLNCFSFPLPFLVAGTRRECFLLACTPLPSSTC